jgi:hypothetical protein
MESEFRRYLLPADHPKIAALRTLDARGHRDRVLQTPWLKEWIEQWKVASLQPYNGITNDGRRIPGLFEVCDESAPVEEMMTAANRLLEWPVTTEKRVYSCS